MGKTSLARALPKLLGDKARIALVPDPALSGESSRTTLPLVTVIDPAQKADENSLDHLDGILSYRSDLPPPWSRACPSHDSASKLKATRLTKVINFSSGGSIESKHSNLNSPRFRETALRYTPTSISSARDAKRRNSSAPMQLWPFTRIRVAYLVKALRPAKACYSRQPLKNCPNSTRVLCEAFPNLGRDPELRRFTINAAPGRRPGSIMLVGFGIVHFLSDDALTSNSKAELSRRTHAPRRDGKAAASRTTSAGTISIPDLEPQPGEGTPQLVLFEPAGGFLSANSLPDLESAVSGLACSILRTPRLASLTSHPAHFRASQGTQS